MSAPSSAIVMASTLAPASLGRREAGYSSSLWSMRMYAPLPLFSFIPTGVTADPRRPLDAAQC